MMLLRSVMCFCLVPHRLVFYACLVHPNGTSSSIEDDVAIHHPDQLPSISGVAIIHVREPCAFWYLYHGHRIHTIQSACVMCRMSPQNFDTDVIQ